jgi:hypothetical protein
MSYPTILHERFCRKFGLFVGGGGVGGEALEAGVIVGDDR